MMFSKKSQTGYKRRKPKRKQRAEFSAKVRKQIMDDNNNSCQMCGGRATQIHHVVPRGRQGRGVYTNGMGICNGCHTLIHQDNELLNDWIELYAEKYGTEFQKDEFDKG